MASSLQVDGVETVELVTKQESMESVSTTAQVYQQVIDENGKTRNIPVSI